MLDPPNLLWITIFTIHTKQSMAMYTAPPFYNTHKFIPCINPSATDVIYFIADTMWSWTPDSSTLPIPQQLRVSQKFSHFCSISNILPCKPHQFFPKYQEIHTNLWISQKSPQISWKQDALYRNLSFYESESNCFHLDSQNLQNFELCPSTNEFKNFEELLSAALHVACFSLQNRTQYWWNGSKR